MENYTSNSFEKESTIRTVKCVFANMNIVPQFLSMFIAISRYKVVSLQYQSSKSLVNGTLKINDSQSLGTEFQMNPILQIQNYTDNFIGDEGDDIGVRIFDNSYIIDTLTLVLTLEEIN